MHSRKAGAYPSEKPRMPNSITHKHWTRLTFYEKSESLPQVEHLFGTL